MNYKDIAKETIGNLYKAHHSIRKSGIDEKLIALVELRVSQINGCVIAAVITLKNYPILALNRMSSTGFRAGNIPVHSMISKSLF
ncbi:carboxymuconolactone decarboxylase family protein [Chryseobacterium sp. 7]|uniref:carboxymuconolactone decarboxylase family protein n=1 Tax=Chryseobacterium sp. 7 TaxID=2035214 RepID=UPI001E5ADABB|nr:carboxymuconolactone decarboxylase family protein [Chryseobacterium sp. 7]